MSGQSYKDLLAWQKAIDLVEEVYRATRGWPQDELFGLTNQVRRAVVSIPSNVAEGQGRHNHKEFLRYVQISNSSLNEVETQLLIAKRLEYIDEEAYRTLTSQADDVGRLLHGLMRSLRSRLSQSPNPPADY